MYIGFELKKISINFFDNFSHYLNIGKQTTKKYNKTIKDTLNKFEKSDGSLDGDKMQSDWFPQINADIFLSHSHADKDLVIAFAGWLKETFNLDAFIDSSVWGYFKDLQTIIDDRYSRNMQGILCYDPVLYASSHVHMMLNTALMKMIDNCECIIFINTPNSVKPFQVAQNLISPWIYSEIAMTKLIKRKSLQQHRTNYINENKTFSELKIDYNLDTDHLIQLNINDLANWKSFFSKNAPLDYLYKINV